MFVGWLLFCLFSVCVFVCFAVLLVASACLFDRLVFEFLCVSLSLAFLCVVCSCLLLICLFVLLVCLCLLVGRFCVGYFY